MGALTPNFTATENADGGTITLTDTSDWLSSGNDRADFVRSFLLTDAYGTVLDTIILPDDSDVATYTITKPTWLTILYSAVDGATYSKEEKFPFDRLFVNKYQVALRSGCCGNASKSSILSIASDFYTGAKDDAPLGNAVSWQTNILVANTYISQL